MPSRINIQIRDFTNEYSTVSIPVTPVTAANYDTVLGNLATQGRNELEAAIDGVSAGNISKTAALAYDEPVNDTQPTEPFAQRELGLRVYGRGADSGKLYTITIAAPDLDVLTVGTNDEVTLADAGPMAALVTALEDNWKGYINEQTNVVEALTVERATIVGRRN